MQIKNFALALVSIAAAVEAKESWYGKHFVDYMHGHDNLDTEYMTQLLEDRKAKVQANEAVEPLTIHLVPHTHDDIGWLKTIDGYFTGHNQSTAIANVGLILDTVIDSLILDETKVFTYVEMKFFTMWYERQTDRKKEQVKTLVKNHQLEFVNAGWSMHDEACTHYDDMINNMMIGHEFLKKEFDYVPTIGWHIDPFGHSNANPRLFADMGFDTFIFGRLDYEDREQRLADKTMQFVWKPFSESLGDEVEIFTHILQDMYWFPPDMGYDERDYQNVSEPIIDDETLETFNADKKSLRMAVYALHMSQHYRSTHMFMPWGEDFAYGNAFSDFKNGDALVRYWQSYVKDQLNIDMKYSTIYDYVNAVKAEDITWPTKYDDMFPYADWEDQYWTGYFTSRANSKSQIRYGSQNLLASNKIYAEKIVDQTTSHADIESIKQARYTMLDSMGSYQHHDAATGTAQQHVANDYSFLLSKSLDKSNVEFTKHIADYSEQFAGIQSSSWGLCSVTNLTYVDCPILPDTAEFVVTTYNPSTKPYKMQSFKVPPSTNYDVEVYDTSSSTWNKVQSTLLCYDFIENNEMLSTYEDCNLYVQAEGLPHHMTFMKVTASTEAAEDNSDDSSQVISTSTATLSYEGQTESGTSLFQYEQTGEDAQTFEFALQYYNPSDGKSPNLASSGAYLFVPQINDQFSHVYSEFKSIKVNQGTLKSEFVLLYEDSKKEAVYQALIRIGEGEEPIEFEVQMLEIPLIDNKGREVVAKWTVHDFDNDQTFYTDSNSLEMQKRVLDYRPDFTLNTTMKVNNNYYPVNSAIAMRSNKGMQVTVVNQHSQGGSSIENGSLELMQNRRLLHDDNKGVTEPLNETQADGRGIAVNTKYWLSFTNLSKGEKSMQRSMQLHTEEPLQIFYSSDFTITSIEKNDNFVAANAAKKNTANSLSSFDGDLRLLLFPEHQNQILIRLENLSDLFDGVPTETSYFNLLDYATEFYKANNGGAAPTSIDIHERTLSNNQGMDTMKANKFKWKSVDSSNSRLAQAFEADADDFSQVQLQPQRIRLYRVVYNSDSAAKDPQILTE